MSYWLSRDDDQRASYDLWTKRPTWNERWGWQVLDKNGHWDHKQPIDSYRECSFPNVSGLRLMPGELTRVTKFEVTVKRVKVCYKA